MLVVDLADALADVLAVIDLDPLPAVAWLGLLGVDLGDAVGVGTAESHRAFEGRQVAHLEALLCVDGLPRLAEAGDGDGRAEGQCLAQLGEDPLVLLDRGRRLRHDCDLHLDGHEGVCGDDLLGPADACRVSLRLCRVRLRHRHVSLRHGRHECHRRLECLGGCLEKGEDGGVRRSGRHFAVLLAGGGDLE